MTSVLFKPSFYATGYGIHVTKKSLPGLFGSLANFVLNGGLTIPVDQYWVYFASSSICVHVSHP